MLQCFYQNCEGIELLMKRILIFYASYGGGHLSAAKSIKQYIEDHYTDVTIEMLDCVEYISQSLNSITTAAYRGMAKKAPWAWEKVYTNSSKGMLSKVSSTSNKIMAVKIAKLFRSFSPDIVISTHPFGSQMTSYLKKKQKTNCILATVMTDFAPHDQWLIGKEHVNFFFVSNEVMKQQMIASGVDADSIVVSGIPISKRFCATYDRAEILQSFGLKENKKTALFFGGGEFGLGKEKTINVLKALCTISYPVQVVAIAGKNEKMKKAFEDIVAETNKQNSVKVLPFTDKVPELMSISDFVITKPGGLTSSESLASSLPIVVINPIPGQEEENAEFLVQSGAAIWLKQEDDPQKIFSELLNDAEKLLMMKENAKKIAKKNASKDICEILLSDVIRKDVQKND